MKNLAFKPLRGFMDRLRHARPSDAATLKIETGAHAHAPRHESAATDEAPIGANDDVKPVVLTARGGPCSLPDHIRNHCAILSNGDFYVRASKITDHDILDAGNVAEIICPHLLPRGKVGRPIPCEDDKLNDLYGEQALAPIKNRAEILNQFWRIIERGTKNRATEIQIRMFHGRLTVRYEVNGVLTQPIAEFELIGREGAHLFTVAHNQGDRGDPIENPDVSQERTIVNAKKLEHTPCNGIRMKTLRISGGRHLNLRPMYRSLPITGDGLAPLGLTARGEKALYASMNYKRGVIVVSGPTASGKTTLVEIYSITLNASYGGTKLIVFLTDPPEAEHDSLTHIEVRGELEGAGFREGKKDLLRINPHVTGIGEARDLESAFSGYEIARTGKPCLMTVHVDHALSIPMRMIDFGVPRSNVFDPQVNLAWTGQRMISCLCQKCAKPAKDSKNLRIQAIFEDYQALLGADADKLKVRGTGCPECLNVGEGKLATPGYVGARKLVFEIVRPDSTLCRLLEQGDVWGAREYWLTKLAGMESMELQAFPLLISGQVAIDDFSNEFSNLEVLKFDLELAGLLEQTAQAAE